MRRAVLVAALLAPAATGPATAAPPEIRQMVVFPSGAAVTKEIRALEATVRVGRRRCAVAAGTALAALTRSRVARLRLRDFGSCSHRPRDGGGLFVSAIGSERNRGQDGWVYKVGRRAATAGAADPGGPFGNGRLRPGRRVTWFYCRLRGGGCQRSLELKPRVEPGALVATVRGYDDEGRGIPVAGARVAAGGMSALTGPDGVARLALAPGRYRAVATRDGLVRSFAERVEVP